MQAVTIVPPILTAKDAVHHRQLERHRSGHVLVTDEGWQLFLESFERGYEDLQHVRAVGLNGGGLVVQRVDYKRVFQTVIIDVRDLDEA